MNTSLPSDIRILDNLLALNLDISLWSARRKMSAEDLAARNCRRKISPRWGPNALPTRKACASSARSRRELSTSWTGTASVSCPVGPSPKTRPGTLWKS